MEANSPETIEHWNRTFLASSLITRISRYYHVYLNNALKPLGLNASQYLYIIVLCKEKAIRQDKLPRRLGINKSNVTRALAQLEKNGFICRRPNAGDKRTYDIAPTEKAVAMFGPVMDILRQWDHMAIDLDDGEKRELRRLLGKILVRSESIGMDYLDE